MYSTSAAAHYSTRTRPSARCDATVVNAQLGDHPVGSIGTPHAFCLARRLPICFVGWREEVEDTTDVCTLYPPSSPLLSGMTMSVRAMGVLVQGEVRGPE